MTARSPITEKPSKLRWYQWRLRSLFILTLLVAVGMSWLTVEMRNERRQKAAAEEITKMGGRVESEPTWLAKLFRDDSLVRVTRVVLPKSTTDGDLAVLRDLSQLQVLMLQDTKVTGAGLVHLEGLSQLQGLDFFGSQVTDAGLVHLRWLRRLQLLGLQSTRITDAGLVHLEEMKELQQLVLTGTTVTDAGLEHLKGLTHLQELYLVNTKVTDHGIKKLQQALPNCKIEH